MRERHFFLGCCLLFGLCGCGSTSNDKSASGGEGGGSKGGQTGQTGGRVATGGAAGSGGNSSGRGGDEATGGLGTTGGDDGSPPSNPCYGGCEKDRPTPSARPDCPGAEPDEGAACDIAGKLCSYGDNPEAACRHYWLCDGGSWKVDPESTQVACKEVPDGFCPARAEQGAECVVSSAGKGVPCVYPGLSCYCLGTFNAMPGSSGTWLCYGPPADANCPEKLPDLGEGCSTPGTECKYSADGCTGHKYSSVFCFEGAWEVGSGYDCVGF
jgi:hypothetical protein